MGLFAGEAEKRSEILLAEMLKAESITASGRKFDGRMARIVKGLQLENELLAHDLKMAAAIEKALKQKIAILEEAQMVLRDALAAHQMTSRLHSAEGKVLMQEVAGNGQQRISQ